MTAGDLYRTVGNMVDESFIMAHQHHSFGRLSEKLFQPLNAFNVEVIGGFIEQKHVRPLQQYLRKFDTHTPSARKFGRRAIEIRSQKAQSRQCAFHFSLIPFGPDHHVALVFLRKLLYQGKILLTLVVGTFAQFALHAVYAFFQSGVSGKGFSRFFEHGSIIRELHHLWKITDSGIARNGYSTRRGLLHAAQNLEQSRFPRAVLAHQGDTVAVVHHEIHIVEQRFNAKLYFQTFY